MAETTETLQAHASWLIQNLRSRMRSSALERKSMSPASAQALMKWTVDVNASIPRIMSAPTTLAQDKIYNSLVSQHNAILKGSTERNAGTNIEQTGHNLQTTIPMPPPSPSDGKGNWVYWVLGGVGLLILLS